MAKATKKAAAKPAPAASKAVKKSLSDVKKAQKNLDLKMKKHHQVVSAMFFFG
jgi:hypothetical protein